MDFYADATVRHFLSAHYFVEPCDTETPRTIKEAAN